jgi:hypothetical protein
VRHRFVLSFLIWVCVLGLGLGRVFAGPPERGSGQLMKRQEQPRRKSPTTDETVAAEIHLRPELTDRLLDAARDYVNSPQTAEKIQDLIWEKQKEYIVPLFRDKAAQANSPIDPGALLMPVDEKGEPLGLESALAVRIPASSVGFEMQVKSLKHSKDPKHPEFLFIEAELESAVIEVPNVEVGVAYRGESPGQQDNDFNEFKALPISANGQPVEGLAARVRVENPKVRFKVWLPPHGLDVVIRDVTLEVPSGGLRPEIRNFPDRIQLGTPEGGKIGVSISEGTRTRISRQLESKLSEKIESKLKDPTLFENAEVASTEAAQGALKNLEFSIPLNIRQKVPLAKVQSVIVDDLVEVYAWGKKPVLLRPLAKLAAIESLAVLARDMAADIEDLLEEDSASVGIVQLAEQLRQYFLSRFPELQAKLSKWQDSRSILGASSRQAGASAFLSDLAAAFEQEKDKLKLEVRDYRMIQKTSILRNRFLGPDVAVKLSSESRLRDSTVTANIHVKGVNAKMLRGNITCSTDRKRDRDASDVALSLEAPNQLFAHLFREDPQIYNDLLPGFKFLKPPVIAGVPGTSKVRLVMYGVQDGTDLGGAREDAKMTYTVEGEVQPTVDGKGLRVQALQLISANEKHFTAERLLYPLNWFATQIFNVGSIASTAIARGEFNKAKPSLRKELEIALLKSSKGRISAIQFNKDNQMMVSFTEDVIP